MYKRLTSNMRPGPDLLQKVPTLVLNVDFLMIMSVKGPVGSIYCKQSMFLSLLMIFCSYTPVKCDQVLIYCRQCLLLSWMLTFSWLCVSRDLWDPFIADSQCSCPCWWYFFIHTSKMRPDPDLLQTVSLLSWMLTFSWLCVSRDLWDPFIANQ